MDRLFQEVQYIKGVGPQRSKLLSRVDVKTAFDLLWYIPRAYYNRNKFDNISELQEGSNASIRGKVINVVSNRSRRGFNIFKAVLDDGTGIITAVWFNQTYLANIIKPDQELFVSGKAKKSYGMMELSVGEYEIIDPEDINISIVPIYPLTDGLSQKVLRSIIRNVLENFLLAYPEIFDAEIRNSQKLCGIKQAFQNIHFPENGENFLMAKRRLAFEELVLFKLKLIRERESLNKCKGIRHRDPGQLLDKISGKLPYELTTAQQNALQEILGDMESDRKMNRLLQGDVGSGKTVVAALAMAKAVAGGYQAAFMAPTEILINQHYRFLNRLFATDQFTIACLTGSTSAAERRLILDALATGEIDILIGTHALFQEDVHFKNLGLAIIDEQHRFGVRQRALFSQKGAVPDVLVMTATPIPRTLALTVYGDLDLSVIDELPPGRKPVKTIYVKRPMRHRVYDLVEKEVKQGAQAYIVCPLVEESEKQDLQAAVSLHQELTNIYPNLKIGLIHGRMKSNEKDFVMEVFKKGQIQVLVTTTIIEVGVDVPNASIILVEHAERFGLSQLHQLRGRVGRGPLQSYCILVGDPRTEEAFRRLKAMEKTNNGFELANEDLVIRGPGDFWGVKQHGLDNLKVASLLKNQKMIEQASQVAAIISPLVNQNSIVQQYIENKFKSQDIAIN